MTSSNFVMPTRTLLTSDCIIAAGSGRQTVRRCKNKSKNRNKKTAPVSSGKRHDVPAEYSSACVELKKLNCPANSSNTPNHGKDPWTGSERRTLERGTADSRPPQSSSSSVERKTSNGSLQQNRDDFIPSRRRRPRTNLLYRSSSVPLLVCTGRSRLNGTGGKAAATEKTVHRLDHNDYQSYLAGVVHSSHNSDGFLRLRLLYDIVERIGEIETELQEISSTGTSPSSSFVTLKLTV